jgi:hypothetical protein
VNEKWTRRNRPRKREIKIEDEDQDEQDFGFENPRHSVFAVRPADFKLLLEPG